MSYSSVVRNGRVVDPLPVGSEIVKESINPEDFFGAAAAPKSSKKKRVKETVAPVSVLHSFYEYSNDENVEEPVTQETSRSRHQGDANSSVRRPKQRYIQRNPEDVAKSLAKTKVCRNVTNFGSCSRPSCSFAHNADELVPPNCMFDNSCRYLKNNGCKFKHSCETTDEYYTRSGQEYPSFERVPQQDVAQLPRLRKPRAAAAAAATDAVAASD